MIAVAKIAARVLVGAAAGAALLLADATVKPASAQEACKSEYVSATGRGKWRPFSRDKELEGNGAAKRDAIAAWEKKVAANLGESWKRWEFAKGQSEECGLTQGKVFSNLVQCTVRARPCPAPEKGAPPGVAVAVPEKGSGRDRDVVRYAGTSWRYRIEMRHQERLAEWRNRRENWAWRREENRQRYLQARRDRTEERERSRADARERYYARWRD
jgi:hypothetical protein